MREWLTAPAAINNVSYTCSESAKEPQNTVEKVPLESSMFWKRLSPPLHQFYQANLLVVLILLLSEAWVHVLSL